MPTKLILVALVAVVGVVLLRPKSDIDPAKARALVEAGAKLVDVRTPREYSDGHIEGAVNIPVQEVGARLDEFGAKGEPIVVYCRSGNRSSKAQKLLRSEGFEQVHNLGPMSAWR